MTGGVVRLTTTSIVLAEGDDAPSFVDSSVSMLKGASPHTPLCGVRSCRCVLADASSRPSYQPFGNYSLRTTQSLFVQRCVIISVSRGSLNRHLQAAKSIYQVTVCFPFIMTNATPLTVATNTHRGE